MRFWLVILGILLAAGIGGGLWLRSLIAMPELEAPTLTGELATGAVEHDGLQRSYRTYRPARHAAQRPLVFVLHGSQGDGARARGGYAYEWDRLADREGFLVVYPDGFDRHWNGCRRAGPYRANLEDVDDVGFLIALAQRLGREHGADLDRLYATGISNGGQMALRLALEAPARVRAVAPVVASLPARDNMSCRTEGRPVSILLMNGTEDPMNPYEGGKVALYGWWGDRGNVLSSVETIGYWAELAGYDGAPAVDMLPDVDPDDGGTIERRRWRAPGRAHVELWSVRGGGHTVPHPTLRMPRLIGATNGDITAAQVIWDFFREAP